VPRLQKSCLPASGGWPTRWGTEATVGVEDGDEPQCRRIDREPRHHRTSGLPDLAQEVLARARARRVRFDMLDAILRKNLMPT
jgi:hypothetical protein